jgi:Cu2+-exporting ATPase
MSVASCPACVAIPEDQVEMTAQEQAGKLLFSVPDVHCAGCIGTVEKAVLTLPGVREARLNLSLKRLFVDADPGLNDAIIAKLASVGHLAQPLDETTLESGKDPEGRRLLMRLGVSGFAMMNVMLLSVSVWAGAEGETRNFLHWISAAIAMPTVAFAGVPFFISGWAALSKGKLNMDVPISLALLLAIGLSLYETSVGGEDAYFDAALSLTFFLLLGRYLNHRTRMAARSAALELAALETKTALMIENGETRAVPIAQLQRGDRVLVQPGMAVPVDGRVVSGQSDLDKSLLTGETLPESVEPGSDVYTGTMNLTGPLEVEITGNPEDSVLRQITELVSLAEAAKSRYTGLAERAAGIYAPVVHLVAFAGFIGWYLITGDIRHSLNIAVAVLIITCPCALGLAVPAVMTATVSRLFQAGVLVKDGSAVERLAQVEAVVFDKTGTLTKGQAELSGDTDPEILSLAAGLAEASAHPLSKSILAAARSRGVDVAKVTNITEIAGKGLQGQYQGRMLRLGRAEWLDVVPETNRGVQSWLQWGDDAPVALQFTDPPREDARQTVQVLKEEGLPVYMLTGDRAEVAAPLAEALGIENVEAQVLPEAKLRRVEALGDKTLMVGDGLNDAAAMSGAFVSVAPASAIDATRASADFILLGNDLTQIPRAIRLSRQARARILENFTIAGVYNLVAVPLALLGYASPLAAAIAMSSSSILVSLNALRLLRSKT